MIESVMELIKEEKVFLSNCRCGIMQKHKGIDNTENVSKLSFFVLYLLLILNI